MTGNSGSPTLRAILVPYDSGRRGFRMGRGPEHLLENGLEEALRRARLAVRPVVLELGDAPPLEVAAAFALNKRIAEEARAASGAGESPLVLSGNCNACVGTVAGVGAEGLGILWFDAHADFNTPETTTSGFVDGMGLAIAVGDCWGSMAATIPGFVPVDAANVVLVGARDVQPAEQERLDEAGIGVVAGGPAGDRRWYEGLGAALDGLRTRVARVYVHLDLDVLDPEKVGKANGFAVPGGLTRGELEEALVMIRERFRVAAVGVASYDPGLDEEGAVLETAFSCIAVLEARDPAP